ncbi:helix-turn-helix domain-containing protein [Bradyrhizobium sp. USDA 4529]
MKLASDSKRGLLDEMQAQIAARHLSAMDISRSSGVDQSQVSRILAGDFKRISQNVMQICNFLGINPGRFVGSLPGDDDTRRRIADSALSVWDGTPEGAELLISIFGGMAAIRGGRRR